MESLKLILPVQHDFTDPTVETDLARLRAWLDDLPLMDVVETLHLVRGGLDGLNAQRLAPGPRLELLEAYRATSEQLMHSLDPLQLGQLKLSRTRRTEAIAGIGCLLQSLAGGYKLLVADLYAGSSRDKPQPQLDIALHRALQLMVYVLLDSYRFYREVQPAQIAETHQLYRLARSFGFLGVTAPDAGVPGVTTAGYYHAGMLLALAEPARLEEGEAGLLYDVLLRHADDCRILPGNSWEGAGEGIFLLDLQGDSLPQPCIQLESPVVLKDAYLLDANPALRAIREQLAGTPAGLRMQSPEAMVLRRLLPEDRGTERRRQQRHPDGRYVSLLHGLAQIHAYLLRGPGKGAASTGSGRSGQPQCRVLDSSAMGMKLAWEEGGAGDACVGDLLGVLEQQQGRQVLRLAIIRSVRVPAQGEMETGVQLLAGGVGAVYCTLADQPGSAALPALFMPADESERTHATLLAAKGVYAFGSRLIINVSGRTINVRAGRRVFDSPVFDRFEFAAH